MEQPGMHPMEAFGTEYWYPLGMFMKEKKVG
jgi:hypothetical protein